MRARSGGRSCSRYAATAITFEDRIFGSCAPAVREGRKLCCGSLIGGILNDSGRGH